MEPSNVTTTAHSSSGTTLSLTATGEPNVGSVPAQTKPITFELKDGNKAIMRVKNDSKWAETITSIFYSRYISLDAVEGVKGWKPKTGNRYFNQHEYKAMEAELLTPSDNCSTQKVQWSAELTLEAYVRGDPKTKIPVDPERLFGQMELPDTDDHQPIRSLIVGEFDISLDNAMAGGDEFWLPGTEGKCGLEGTWYPLPPEADVDDVEETGIPTKYQDQKQPALLRGLLKVTIPPTNIDLSGSTTGQSAQHLQESTSATEAAIQG